MSKYLWQVLNKLMFSASSDGTAKSWITEFGDCTRTYKGHKHSVLSFCVSDGIRKYSFIYIDDISH